MNLFTAEIKIRYFEQLWEPHNCLVTNILQNILFWVQQNKEMHTGLAQLGVSMTTSFSFWVNYPFTNSYSHNKCKPSTSSWWM